MALKDGGGGGGGGGRTWERMGRELISKACVLLHLCFYNEVLQCCESSDICNPDIAIMIN